MPDGTIEYSQEDRLLAIKTTLGETELLLEIFGHGVRLGSLRIQADDVVDQQAVDIKSLLRTSVTVTLIMSDGSERYFNACFRASRRPRGDGLNQG